MCGVAGFLDFGRTMSAETQGRVCEAMANTLRHRGPDDGGVWTDAAAGVALGHRRLSILDLSPLGHQPMSSASGRYVVAYNGEIYNFEELRSDLAAYPFRGRSDTEVMLAAFEAWGIEGALPRFNGMFAIALWDTRERVLWLARDRFGEKPLYYGRVGQALVFASELKAVRAFPGFRGEIDRGALTQFLRFGYVPTPSCIFADMKKLPPATYLRVASETDVDRTPSSYWSLEAVARDGVAHPFRGSQEDAARELDAALRKSVKLRMVSDVPIGAFLSGGIDSSTVVALMQADATRRVRTFTMGSTDAALDEAPAARRIAEHLGTDHTELCVSPDEALAVIPDLPTLYDEPFADSSQIPTFLVSKLARQHVTVALSGDGGDELFGGYGWYGSAAARWRRLEHMPRGLAEAAGCLAGTEIPSRLGDALRPAFQRLPARARARVPGDLLPKLVHGLSARDSAHLFRGFQSAWVAPSALTGTRETPHPTFDRHPPELDDFVDRMMCMDAVAYLPDDILVKVDRAAMGVGLETRVPMLDPDVARLAWSLPRRFKMADGRGKLVLRDVLARHVPRALFEGPKKGFGIPVSDWLRGPLRDWAEAELSVERLTRDGLLEPKAVRRRWSDVRAGMRGAHGPIWYVLMFQAWLRKSTTMGEP